MKLDKAVLIVTGGASGLGAAVATEFAAAGAKVGIIDRNADLGTAHARSIGAAFAAADVADEGSARAALAQLEAQNGIANVLVNCAGIGTAARIVGKDGPMPLGDFERVIRVNLIGTFNMMRLVADRMQHRPEEDDGERGVIISTASVAAYEGQIGQAAYAASKAGIIGLTVPVARELARHGIRVNTIAPGLFLTPLLAELPEEVQAGLARSIPFPARLGAPQDFSAMVRAMVENPYLNGETVRLDGALRMQPK